MFYWTAEPMTAQGPRKGEPSSSSMRNGLRPQPARLVRGSSRRIMSMRFRPANIRVINRRVCSWAVIGPAVQNQTRSKPTSGNVFPLRRPSTGSGVPERCSPVKGSLRRAKKRRALDCSAPFRPDSYRDGRLRREHFAALHTSKNKKAGFPPAEESRFFFFFFFFFLRKKKKFNKKKSALLTAHPLRFALFADREPAFSFPHQKGGPPRPLRCAPGRIPSGCARRPHDSPGGRSWKSPLAGGRVSQSRTFHRAVRQALGSLVCLAAAASPASFGPLRRPASQLERGVLSAFPLSMATAGVALTHLPTPLEGAGRRHRP